MIEVAVILLWIAFVGHLFNHAANAVLAWMDKPPSGGLQTEARCQHLNWKVDADSYKYTMKVCSDCTTMWPWHPRMGFPLAQTGAERKA